MIYCVLRQQSNVTLYSTESAAPATAANAATAPVARKMSKAMLAYLERAKAHG